MKVVLIFLISFLNLKLQAQAQILDSESIKVLGTVTLSNSESEYPFEELDPFKGEKSGILSYSPDGTHFKTPSLDCDQLNLSHLISSTISSNHQLSNETQNWLFNCNPQLKKYAPLMSLIRFQGLSYRLSQNPHVYQIEFTLKNGEKLRAILAIKDTVKSRPLIISKCGLYCDADYSPTINDTLMHLFDEGPFNVLILASSSGYEFAKSNQSSPFGGFVEGDQIMQVAEMLMQDNSIFQNLISEIHLHGISLGGNAALMASVYASHNSSLPIRSVVAACPVINLKESLNDIFGGGLLGTFYRSMTLSHLRKAHLYMPAFMKYLDQSSKKKFKWTGDELHHATSQSALDYLKEVTIDNSWERPPFKNVQINHLEDLWYYNDYANFIDDVNIPTTVVYSSDDMLVKSRANGRYLASQLAENPNPNIGTIDLKEGNHCGFSSGIGWDTYSALINGLFKKYSLDETSRDPASQTMITFNQKWRNKNTRKRVSSLKDNELIIKSEWQVEKKSNQFKLSLNVFNKNYSYGHGRLKLKCSRKSPYMAHRDCYDKYENTLSIEELAQFGFKVPRNTFQTNRLMRWLNINTVLLNSNHQRIKGRSELPTFMKMSETYNF